ncbi:hypothetical protein [Bacillus halotolerans]|uniref:hypothetical protein n=1 Tax=Bacillus halotolerans TaxID=260554 RepID=UPI000C7DF6E7|nr:hypothetical protein [Bacillus halotolerans]PLR90597.1 hypothetical protein CTZ29_13620 [Bacillus halotolerans]
MQPQHFCRQTQAAAVSEVISFPSPSRTPPVNEKVFKYEIKKVLNNPEKLQQKTVVTVETLQAALDIIMEQLKERRKSDR